MTPNRLHAAVAGLLLLASCTSKRAATSTARPPRAPAETARVRDPELEQRVARLEMRVLEREAQIEDLEDRLDEARREVVRAMAKLQTLATRAEAASAMAEAEIAFGAAAGQPGFAGSRVRELLQMSSAEFDKRNYGGSLYLANQAKSLLSGARGTTGGGRALRPGEVPFAVSVRLQTVTTSNVRIGPGTGFAVAFTLPRGTDLVAYSYVGEWIQVSDLPSRSGWVHLSLVGRRDAGASGTAEGGEPR